jgi:hypothetical protein
LLLPSLLQTRENPHYTRRVREYNTNQTLVLSKRPGCEKKRGITAKEQEKAFMLEMLVM